LAVVALWVLFKLRGNYTIFKPVNTKQEGVMIQTIKSVDPLSFGKIYGATLALFGLLVGGLLTLISLTLGGLMGEYGRGIISGFFGAAAIVVLPILYGVIGFIVGLVGAFIYNIVARVVGGIKIDLSE
jgi:hypothetical protein